MKMICDNAKMCVRAKGCKHGVKHDPYGVGCEKDFCARAGIDSVQCVPVPEPSEVREIVKEHLIAEGYDGLVEPDGECACFVAGGCSLVYGELRCRHIAPRRKESNDDAG
jgi:hypothetical protein